MTCPDCQGTGEIIAEKCEKCHGKKVTREKVKKEITRALDDAQDRALEVIRSRIDNLGTREPIIYPERSSRRIVVQVPGINTAEEGGEEATEDITNVFDKKVDDIFFIIEEIIFLHDVVDGIQKKTPLLAQRGCFRLLTGG